VSVSAHEGTQDNSYQYLSTRIFRIIDSVSDHEDFQDNCHYLPTRIPRITFVSYYKDTQYLTMGLFWITVSVSDHEDNKNNCVSI
jgi:hypothetical protein